MESCGTPDTSHPHGGPLRIGKKRGIPSNMRPAKKVSNQWTIYIHKTCENKACRWDTTTNENFSSCRTHQTGEGQNDQILWFLQEVDFSFSPAGYIACILWQREFLCKLLNKVFLWPRGRVCTFADLAPLPVQERGPGRKRVFS